MLFALALLGCKPPTESLPVPPTDGLATGDTGRSSPVPGEVWVEIEGDAFLMGDDRGAFSWPRHWVDVPSFLIMRREIQSTDYRDCFEAGVCTAPGLDPLCADGTVEGLPQNCLDWNQARTYCEFAGGRLPTEAEWEFAARSSGRHIRYPWGDEPPDCDRANLSQPDGLPWCEGYAGVWESCTHPAGDTQLGLCEVGGNVFEWVEDWFYDDYTVHPTDGSAQLDYGLVFRSMRGGSIGSTASPDVFKRTFHPPEFWFGGMGARCAADL